MALMDASVGLWGMSGGLREFQGSSRDLMGMGVGFSGAFQDVSGVSR